MDQKARDVEPFLAKAFEKSHGEDAKGLDYGNEFVIKLANGNTIRTDTYQANEAGSSYVRVCDPRGFEVAYWTYEEWEEDPQLVMGAFLGVAGTAVCGKRYRTTTE